MSTTEATETQDGLFAGYAGPEGERPPFAARAFLAAVFNGGYAAALVAARRSGRGLPEHVAAGDLVLIGVAGHKLSRLITKQKVTVFIRAPFTEHQGKGGPGEVDERPRGTGLRKSIGELLTCPFCLGLWLVGAGHIGLVYAPRETRIVASTFSSLAVSDFLQIAYKAAEKKGLES